MKNLCLYQPFLRVLTASMLLMVSVAVRAETYIVLYQGNALPANAAATISAAGGTLLWGYSEIGVAIAQSNNASFANTVNAAAGVLGAAATTGLGVRLNDSFAAVDALDTSTVAPALGIPAPGDDPLSGLQWDMVQISAPQARAVNGGDPSIVVGDIDTGLDFTHPDLAPNVDFGNSVSCIGGVPNPSSAAWNDDNGHGTHTAGTIAAAKNGIGIVGVAPNVRIAAIKAGDTNGFFFPEAVVCAFVWAGTHHIQVTNNSYFADPWLFNCRNDPGQRAIWEAERRAIRFAQQRGTVVVAAEGNEADDLAHPTMDITSPDNTTPVPREITNACAVIPVEIPGVIGVTADGNKVLKSFYSSYGVGTVQVIAPGGDSVLQRTAATPAPGNGRVLSTFPKALIANCFRQVIDASGATYCYLQGTSMASPHVAGVAALVASTGVTSPGAIAAKVMNTADPVNCPADLSIYAPFPSVSNGKPQVCQGATGYNGFNGHGQVNALTAVSK
jgi:subtilisin family serine protease